MGYLAVVLIINKRGFIVSRLKGFVFLSPDPSNRPEKTCNLKCILVFVWDFSRLEFSGCQGDLHDVGMAVASALGNNMCFGLFLL